MVCAVLVGVCASGAEGERMKVSVFRFVEVGNLGFLGEGVLFRRGFLSAAQVTKKGDISV